MRGWAVCLEGGGGITVTVVEAYLRRLQGTEVVLKIMVSEYTQCMYLPVQFFPVPHLVPLIEEKFNTETNASAEIGRRDYTMYSNICTMIIHNVMCV